MGVITAMDDEPIIEVGSEPAWHSDHPLFWRWFGYYWLRVRRWLWNHGASKLFWSHGNCPPARKWWIAWCNPGYVYVCEFCGYDYEWASDDWFKCENAGTSYVPGEPDIHWFEGVQTCPRCRSTWDYGDSD